jgi:hypothetical protein
MSVNEFTAHKTNAVNYCCWFLFFLLQCVGLVATASNLSATQNLCSQLARGYGMAAAESCSPNVGKIW